MINVKLYTHEVVGEVDEDTGGEVRSKLLDLELPESAAEEVARAFFDNPAGDTSVHEETAQRFGL